MQLLKQALIFLENLVFPPCCLICGKSCQKILCRECKNKLYKKAELKETEINEKEYYFKKHIYIFEYKKEIRNLILDYKFHDKSYLYKIFSEIIIKNKKIFGILKKYDIILPVPIHKKRKSQRGYDQSVLIAKAVAQSIENLEYKNSVLQKIKNTLPQSTLNKNERKQNAKNAYKIKNKEKIQNKKIILLDDIYTTGNTVNECSRILKENGAKEIIVLTIAKD